MNRRPVVPRESARRDVEVAITYYLERGAVDAALGLVDELELTYLTISEHPEIGSTRWADELNLSGLRTRGLARYPYLVFYIERADHVDVWRVLHSRRDLPAAVADPRSTSD